MRTELQIYLAPNKYTNFVNNLFYVKAVSVCHTSLI